MATIDYDRINWQNNLNTPLGARNQNKMDKAIDDIATYINKTGEYVLLSDNWIETTHATYPYVNEIALPDVFTIEDHPLAQVWGMEEIESQEELDGISYIKKVIANPQGIKVYATAIPSVNLKLVLKSFNS